MKSFLLMSFMISIILAKRHCREETFECIESYNSCSSDIDSCSYENMICEKIPKRVCKVVSNKIQCAPARKPKFNCKSKLKQVEMIFKNICVCMSKFVKAEMCELTRELLCVIKNRDDKAIAYLMVELENLEKNIDKAISAIIKDLLDNSVNIISGAGANVGKAATGLINDLNTQIQANIVAVAQLSPDDLSTLFKNTTSTGAGAQFQTYMVNLAKDMIAATDKIINDAINQERSLIADETEEIFTAIDSAFSSFEKKLKSLEIIGNSDNVKEVSCLIDKYFKNIFIGLESIISRDAISILIIIKKTIEKALEAQACDTLQPVMAYDLLDC